MVIQYVMWGLLISSLVLLLFLWFRKGQASRWLSVLGMNMLIAVLLLYVIDMLTVYTHFVIPFNYLTLAVVTMLGIPGLLLLVSLKMVLL
jgi:inhibitor of the pro-sigma K processing machinery